MAMGAFGRAADNTSVGAALTFDPSSMFAGATNTTMLALVRDVFTDAASATATVANPSGVNKWLTPQVPSVSYGLLPGIPLV